jgi:hypothetical protein
MLHSVVEDEHLDCAETPQEREQLVIFPTRLDEAIDPDHVVRLLDEILGRVDWSNWEAEYKLIRGQPPIPPRVMASVILYGLLTRIRSTRALEEALKMRIDFSVPVPAEDRVRDRYKSDAADCDQCPLRAQCLSGQSRRREVRHEEHEPHRTKQRALMKTDRAKDKYAQRRHAGERPFAVIKQQFGARQFLTRGLERVKQEWLWMTTAFNLKNLFGLFRSGADPPLESETA